MQPETRAAAKPCGLNAKHGRISYLNTIYGIFVQTRHDQLFSSLGRAPLASCIACRQLSVTFPDMLSAQRMQRPALGCSVEPGSGCQAISGRTSCLVQGARGHVCASPAPPRTQSIRAIDQLCLSPSRSHGCGSNQDKMDRASSLGSSGFPITLARHSLRDALVAELRRGMTDGVSLSGFANMPVAGLHQAFGLRGRGECQLAKAIACEDWSYFR
jgi:hypothetical protein